MAGHFQGIMPQYDGAYHHQKNDQMARFDPRPTRPVERTNAQEQQKGNQSRVQGQRVCHIPMHEADG